MNISSVEELAGEMVIVTVSEDAVPTVWSVNPVGLIVVLPLEPHERSAGPVTVVLVLELEEVEWLPGVFPDPVPPGLLELDEAHE